MNVSRRKAIYKIKMLCHKYQKCRTSENWKNYTTQRNYVRDRPFNLKRGLWFFVSFRNFFSDNTRVRIFTFFPEFKIRLYDKNSESDYFFSSTKFRIFFSATQGIRIFFLEKHQYPSPLEVKWSVPNVIFHVQTHQLFL